MGKLTKVLVVAKTYPLPSLKYKELVCTGGVLEDGSFVRLYPIDYRYRSYNQWFKKYQWIELEIEKNEDDPRPESYRPVDSAEIRVLGEPIKTKKNWAERKEFVLAGGVNTMCELNKKGESEKTFGIIKPKLVKGVEVEEDDREWKAEWKALFEQYNLFGDDHKPLEKIPFKFRYVFECEAHGCKGHRMMNADWEIGQLYRAMRDKFNSEEIAVEKVKQKMLECCSEKFDTHFFVGTIRKYGTWIIVGTFWPKKQAV